MVGLESGGFEGTWRSLGEFGGFRGSKGFVERCGALERRYLKNGLKLLKWEKSSIMAF